MVLSRVYTAPIVSVVISIGILSLVRRRALLFDFDHTPIQPLINPLVPASPQSSDATTALRLQSAVREPPSVCLNHTNAIAFPVPRAGASVKGYVISNNPARFQSAVEVLCSIGMEPIRVLPIPLDSPLVSKEPAVVISNKSRAVASLKLTHFAAVDRIARDESLDADDVSFVFEDDIAIVDGFPRDAVLPALLQGVDPKVGFVYAGYCSVNTCYEKVVRFVTSMSGANVSVTYDRCVGRCTHAYGVTHSRALNLAEKASLEARETLKRLYGTEDESFLVNIDVIYHHGVGVFGAPYVVGSDWTGDLPSHNGLFYQDRKKYPSSITFHR
jgi:hypothetical protein